MGRDKLIEVAAKSDGHAPVLEPGQFCEDRLHHVYHFCAPDGARFASGGDKSQTQVVRRDGKVVGCRPKMPGYMHLNGDSVPNHWTIVDGFWEKVS